MILPTNILGSLHVARRALVAHQTAVDTAGHNLANATTPGYSRQRPELVAAADRGGVDVATIARVRDRFLDFSLLAEQQALGKNRAQEGVLQRLQAVFKDPPGEGLSATLDQFFQGFQALSVNPTDQALRVTVKDQGNRLAQTLQVMRGRVDQLKGDLTTEIRQRVSDANSLITQVTDLNRQIVAARQTSSPNDLLDRRDLLIGRLAEIVGVSVTDRPDGSVQLAMTGSGVLLVDGQSSALLTATVDIPTDTVNLTAGTSGIPITPKSGALAALLDARNLATGAVKQAVSDLDSVARTVALEVNRVHTRGTGLTEHTSLTSTNAVTSSAVPLTAAGLPFTPVTGSVSVIVHDATGAVTANVSVPITAGVTTLDDVRVAVAAIPGLSASITSGQLTITAAAGRTFTFANDTSDTLAAVGLNTFFTGSSSADLAVNAVVAGDVTKIAAAKADGAGLVHSGDGANALAVAQLRSKLAMAAGTQTFTDFYASAVARVGSQMRDASDGVSRQESAVRVVQGLQQQVSGVSTDEELISLSQSQTAYAAAARYATTINDMLQTLLNMVHGGAA